MKLSIEQKEELARIKEEAKAEAKALAEAKEWERLKKKAQEQGTRKGGGDEGSHGERGKARVLKVLSLIKEVANKLPEREKGKPSGYSNFLEKSGSDIDDRLNMHKPQSGIKIKKPPTIGDSYWGIKPTATPNKITVGKNIHVKQRRAMPRKAKK